jgi:hypothetical protein
MRSGEGTKKNKASGGGVVRRRRRSRLVLSVHVERKKIK